MDSRKGKGDLSSWLVLSINLRCSNKGDSKIVGNASNKITIKLLKFSVAKATLQSRMSVHLSIHSSDHQQNPSTTPWNNHPSSFFIHKVCLLDYVQLEDDIGYIQSSNTDLSSSNWT